jgi:anti-sigma factor RsiW
MKMSEQRQNVRGASMISVECRTARGAMGPYRDGGLPAAERQEFEAHVNTCSDCALWLADAQALGGLLRLRADALSEDLPADFSARVMASLPPERQGPTAAWLRFWRARMPLLIGLLAAAAAVAAVMVPLLVGGRNVRASGAAENEAHIHRLAVQSPGAQPLVFQNDLGETVIWVVPEAASGTEAGGKLPEDPQR